MTDQPRFSRPAPLAAVADAIRFFTLLPVPPRFGVGAPDKAMAGIAAASPAAGAIVGLGTGAALAAGVALGLPSTPAAVFATAVGVALTGALHLDGLADFADGTGGGRDRDHALAIMRDSRIGAYGAAALALALLARTALIAALVDRLGLGGAAMAAVAAAALARPLAFLPAAALAPARADGLGRSAAVPADALALGAALGALAAMLFGGLAGGAAAAALGGAAAAAVTLVARRKLGGFTGDVCGAAAELAEIAALAGLVMATHRL